MDKNEWYNLWKKVIETFDEYGMMGGEGNEEDTTFKGRKRESDVIDLEKDEYEVDDSEG